MQHPGHYHRQHQVPLATGFRVQQGLQLQPPGASQDRCRMAMGPATLDDQGVADGYPTLPLEHALDGIYHVGRQGSEAGQGAMLDLLALPIGLAQQGRLVGLALDGLPNSGHVMAPDTRLAMPYYLRYWGQSQAIFWLHQCGKNPLICLF